MESRRSAGNRLAQGPAWQQLVCLPVADGGEGTLETLIHRLTVRFTLKQSPDRLANQYIAIRYFRQPNHRSDRTGTSFRLELVSPVQRSPLYTTSFGTANLFSPPWNTILIPLFYAWVQCYK